MEKVKDAKVDITPVGIVMSDASTPENPRPPMIKPPKVVSPKFKLARHEADRSSM